MSVITLGEWDMVRDAYELVASGRAKRIDGESWSVYAAGTIIRIDFKEAAREGKA